MRARSRPPKPKWWQLYLTLPVLMGVFLLDTHLRLSTGGHEAVQMGSLFLEFILVQIWLRANSRALNYMDEEEFSRTIHVIEIPPFEPTQLGNERQPVPPTPQLEIKGVLGDTFQMNYLDVSSFNVDANAAEGHEETK